MLSEQLILMQQSWVANSIRPKVFSEKSTKLAWCLPALAMVFPTDIAETFWILADYMPEHEKMLVYFKIYIHIFQAENVQNAVNVIGLQSIPQNVVSF